MQIQAMEVKKKKKMDDLHLLKMRDSQIKKLAVAEKHLLEMLHSTMQSEDRILAQLHNQKVRQSLILEKV